jgi:allophanate hydrolase
LDIASLARGYREGLITPREVARAVVARVEASEEGIWTSRRDSAELLGEADTLAQRYPEGGRTALYGVPFAVKDNLDVAGVPTTVACPDYAYVPSRSAAVVDRLRASGALYVGKTNLDQFATGLVGVRSPYGIPKNPFHPSYITGGSSSGSAAAVARGQVAFSVATDTAGSGRVPAAFNNLVGLKPSRGLLSTRGLVPACRSIDCVTVLALSCRDARDVAVVASGFDPSDAFSRREAARFSWNGAPLAEGLCIGIPCDADLVFTDAMTKDAFYAARRRMHELGIVFEEVDMAPFYEAGELLYGGPWLAERLSGIETFSERHPASLLPVIREILSRGDRYRATDAFRAMHRLAELRRACEAIWARVPALLLPTVPGHPTIEEALAEPIDANARLGRYTTFVNLLDLCAVAVPNGFRPDGLPTGVSLVGPWGTDAFVLAVAAKFHASIGGHLGATDWPSQAPSEAAPSPPPPGVLPIAVVGAHLRGEPLNHQLTDRGGVFLRAGHTAARYRLVALPGTLPPKPGLVRVAEGRGTRIEMEVWALPMETVGSFLQGVGAPLAIGTLEVDDGTRVHGFLCEGDAAERAEDISSYGGWRAYLRAQSTAHRE